jgi:DNA-directed RNA polymerase specialized sigma24 family protein
MDPILSDEQLSQLLMDSQPGPAMQELSRRYQQRLKRYLLCITGDEQAALELFPACMADYHNRLLKGQGRKRVSVALFATATAFGQTWLARFSQQRPHLALEGASGLDLAVRWESLSAGLLGLEIRERCSLCLTLFERLSYAEAGEALGIDEPTLRDLAGQALGRLREQLGDGFFAAH